MPPSGQILLRALLFGCLGTFVHPAKILLIPGTHYSHVNLFSTTGKALKDDGHEVYVLTVDRFESDVKNHALNTLIHNAEENDPHKKMEPLMKKYAEGDINMLYFIHVAFSTLSDLCKDINKNNELTEMIHDIGFDLVINDATIFYTCLYMIPYRHGIKYMSMSAVHDPWTFGVSGMPSVEPSQILINSNRMKFLQRVRNTILTVVLTINPLSFFYSKEHMQEFVPEKPYKSFRQLVTESEMVLINHDVTCAGYPRVSAPHYRYVGGSSAKPAEPLPQDLQEFADGAEDGLIILGFGSREAIQLAWKELKPIIMKAFGQLRQRVIVQYALKDVSGIPENVKLVKWLPQNDLLGHPSTKLFITHGGNNGQLEAVFHGVPVLTMPFNGDQQYNALQAKTKGFGLIMDRLTLSEDVIVSNIEELINNKTYSENIRRCSEITRSLPNSQETVVFWVNHILRFGGDHLKSPAIDMPMYQVLMLDVFAFFAMLLIILFVIIMLLCRCLFRSCVGKAKQKKE